MNLLHRYTVLLSISAVLWIQCTQKSVEEKKVKPMVYESMSSQDLERVLGVPNKKDSVSAIFLVNQKKTVAVEKWYYEKRTVLIINDTIKDPNVK